MIDNNEELLNANIFSRAIFGKSSKDEMEINLKYFTEQEEFEKCMVIKELMDIDYCVEDPRKDDFLKLSKIINENKDELDKLSDTTVDINKYYDNGDINMESLNNHLDEIDDMSDEIIYTILESEKMRREYLMTIYNEIKDLGIPTVKKEKTKDLLIYYREKSIDSIKKVVG